MHSHIQISGVTDHYATSDEHALSIARNIVANLNRKSASLAVSKVEEPVYDMEEMTGIIPADAKKGFDVRKVSDGDDYLLRTLELSSFIHHLYTPYTIRHTPSRSLPALRMVACSTSSSPCMAPRWSPAFSSCMDDRWESWPTMVYYTGRYSERRMVQGR